MGLVGGELDAQAHNRGCWWTLNIHIRALWAQGEWISESPEE